MEPKILTTLSGEKIKSKEDFEAFRRGEMLELFKSYVYGRVPLGAPKSLSFSLVEERDIRGIHFKKIRIETDGFSFYIRLFTKESKKPLPTVVYMMHNYQLTNSDIENEADSKFLPIRDMTERGYAVIVFYTVEIDHDNLPDSRYEGSIFECYTKRREERLGDEWGSISAWSFCASRIMDYIETDSELDKDNVAIAGHSRGGKTALWTGALDTRFSFIVSNNSGCLGAAMLRGKKGEHLDYITENTYWFCKNLDRYTENEEMLPVDQHMLLALIAPRLMYIASSSLDDWADPSAERRSARLASEVYKLYDKEGILLPEDDKRVEIGKSYHGGSIGYHVKDGEHSITKEDWNKILAFWEEKRA